MACPLLLPGGYTAILVTWLLGRRLSPAGGGWRWLPWALALGGTLFSLSLTALEPFVIGATCLWCLSSAVDISLLLWWLSAETRRAGWGCRRRGDGLVTAKDAKIRREEQRTGRLPRT